MDSRSLRFDAAHNAAIKPPAFNSTTMSRLARTDIRDPVETAIERTRDYLLAQQNSEGYWVGELEGDTILESEYILLLAFLGRGQCEQATRAANYILNQQLPTGGWSIYPGGPLEISASVKAYFALKITGHDPQAEYMVRARQAILQAGGAERVNSFTRFYLALLGVISYEQCPAVPPEIVLIPSWMPFNIYEMSAWSRTIFVPLSLLWAHRPCIELPPEQDIRELFVTSSEGLPLDLETSGTLDELQEPTWIDWSKFFRRVNRTLKLLERWRIRPFRRLAIRRANQWMQERFADSDGLGAIFPPIVWSVIALKCLGYDDDSSEVQTALGELEKLVISDGASDRLQPCKSPVWDTAIAIIALREANVPPEHAALRRAVDWLLSKEVRCVGDWSVRCRGQEPSGWVFEFNNKFYPDVDDTGMVLIALTRCLPDPSWSADLFPSTVLAGRAESGKSALQQIQSLDPLLAAIRRGAGWVLSMQSRDGGWGGFDANNDREILTRVPFADHNAMIDPSTTDLTARMLEMFAGLGLEQNDSAIRRAIELVWRNQEADHCWSGRWGVNYIYGTWQTLVGLTQIGVPCDDLRLSRAADWLKAKQQSCGGWGESPRTYDEPARRGQGEPTASQTAWALMGLMAAGETHSAAVQRGVQYLLDTQNDDGTWTEDWFTGTGFPRVFYLKYHLYRVYFPLMALARLSQA